MHLVIITRDIDYRTDYLSKSYGWTPKKVRNREKTRKLDILATVWPGVKLVEVAADSE